MFSWLGQFGRLGAERFHVGQRGDSFLQLGAGDALQFGQRAEQFGVGDAFEDAFQRGDFAGQLASRPSSPLTVAAVSPAAPLSRPSRFRRFRRPGRIRRRARHRSRRSSVRPSGTWSSSGPAGPRPCVSPSPCNRRRRARPCRSARRAGARREPRAKRHCGEQRDDKRPDPTPGDPQQIPSGDIPTAGAGAHTSVFGATMPSCERRRLERDGKGRGHPVHGPGRLWPWPGWPGLWGEAEGPGERRPESSEGVRPERSVTKRPGTSPWRA